MVSSEMLQPAMDCVFLKRCCKTLTENRRLQRELQELRVLKFARPRCHPRRPQQQDLPMDYRATLHLPTKNPHKTSVRSRH
jgi:hypothetical protein